jgi:hypothetical protein
MAGFETPLSGFETRPYTGRPTNQPLSAGMVWHQRLAPFSP